MLLTAQLACRPPAWQKSDELIQASKVMAVVGKSCKEHSMNKACFAGGKGTTSRQTQPMGIIFCIACNHWSVNLHATAVLGAPTLKSFFSST